MHPSPQSNQVRSPKNLKLKRSLCRNFQELGYCRYGDKCQFAHGHEELAWNTEKRGMYKTKPCTFFAKKCFCQYGSRCNFSHKIEQMQKEERLKDEEVRRNYREIIYYGKSAVGSKVVFNSKD